MKYNEPKQWNIPYEFVYLIALLRCAVLENNPPNPTMAINFEKLFQIAQYHKIAATVYPYLPTNAIPNSDRQKWKHYFDKAVQQEALVQIESFTICQILEQKFVDNLPFKGVLWQRIYGKRIREYSDVDLLIHDYDETLVSEIMLEHGYCEKRGTVHNVYTKAPFYNFEIHKKLFQRDYRGALFFETIWSRVSLADCKYYQYQMHEDDYFLYEILHMQKHFLDAGIGLRQLADFWLLNEFYSSQKPDLLQNLKIQMNDLNCTQFYSEMCSITKKVFEKGEELPSEWMHFLYRSGCYGSRKNLIDSQINENGMFSFLKQVLFPSYEQMLDRFSILYKMKWMLPLLYIVRIILFPFRSEIRRLVQYIWTSCYDKKTKKILRKNNP